VSVVAISFAHASAPIAGMVRRGGLRGGAVNSICRWPDGDWTLTMSPARTPASASLIPSPSPERNSAADNQSVASSGASQRLLARSASRDAPRQAMLKHDLVQRRQAQRAQRRRRVKLCPATRQETASSGSSGQTACRNCRQVMRPCARETA